MTRKWAFLGIILALVFGPAVWAGGSGELDGSSQEALQKTLRLLTQPGLRTKALQSGDARNADQQLRSAVGDQDAEKAYGLAAKIFEEMVKRANGDMSQLAAEVEQAQRDPQKFAESLSSAERRELIEIAHRHPSSSH